MCLCAINLKITNRHKHQNLDKTRENMLKCAYHASDKSFLWK